MLNELLTRLSGYIKLKNPYFDKAFPNVHTDDTQGVVNDEQVVFPSDMDGDYFYLRRGNGIGLSEGSQISSCITGLNYSVPLFLIAVVKDADTDKLITNLVNTLQSFSSLGKSFTALQIDPTAVTRQELSFMSAENLQGALQRIPQGTAIVSISFTITESMPFSHCTVNPCKEC